MVVKTNSKPGTTAGGVSNGPTGTALSNVVTDTTSVPNSTLDKVGAGSGVLTGLTKAIKRRDPAASDGKPEVLYMGAEYCPFCAAERWAMVVALSRFGTFSGLSTVHSRSNSDEVFPNTPTWTFESRTYTSKYLTFSTVEMKTNVPNGSGSYTTLQTPSSAEQALLSKYDAPPVRPLVERGRHSLHRLRKQVHAQRGQVQPAGPAGQELGQIAAASRTKPDRQGGRRHG